MVLTMRPVAAGDQPFLYGLYASTRAEEFAFLPEPERGLLVQMQFRAQQQGYQAQFTESEHRLLLSFDVPVGQLWIATTAEEVRVVDLSVLPAYRNQGLGTAVLTTVLQTAQLPVRLQVLPDNPALRLYTRLGFRPIGMRGLHLALEFSPSSGTG